MCIDYGRQEILALICQKVGNDNHGMTVSSLGFSVTISDLNGQFNDSIGDHDIVKEVLESFSDGIGRDEVWARLNENFDERISVDRLIYQLADAIYNEAHGKTHDLLKALLERGAWLTSRLAEQDQEKPKKVFYVDCTEVARWNVNDASEKYHVINNICDAQFYPRNHAYSPIGKFCVRRHRRDSVLVSRHLSKDGAEKAAQWRRLVDEGWVYQVSSMAEAKGKAL